MITLSDAVASLRPDIKWAMYNEDIENIEWQSPNVEPLTVAEVEAEMVRLESEEATTEATRQATIQAARDHAGSLGFTDAMLAVMYPNLAP
jgi:hypothetical protein